MDEHKSVGSSHAQLGQREREREGVNHNNSEEGTLASCHSKLSVCECGQRRGEPSIDRSIDRRSAYNEADWIGFGNGRREGKGTPKSSARRDRFFEGGRGRAVAHLLRIDRWIGW